MSTENNLDKIYKNSIKILTDLIAFKTISGNDNNSLINYCDDILKNLGATSFRIFDVDKKRYVSATTNYSTEIVSAIEKENIFGTQFHPEKSQANGIKILENFVKI